MTHHLKPAHVPVSWNGPMGDRDSTVGEGAGREYYICELMSIGFDQEHIRTGN